ncbi:uncharacterized protein CcaverHIS019_0113190 [Cutaneotrichosporon cavernicola]|uniref:Uncharacterized protein n=1 Tax=Cutaneotrichosporon cavernicola TaxID=279322 RepID=A0AA48I008_9TREE|nr:uncharacterized protein CcaverHIS019_0113190 [Cutaneotrichosporon cavernicola]BEI88601.1 hypothetical protein CcaverHIS019_0113190 [Cutaneotrichosporon cavernicola]BEI96374.1 hypothetical protein CcaverHIS631_0113230 [Cutaneotrichosporon cavernicola]BEJ04146.1 hypothetical protein CcaverHIS641_0113210 [Cutaneotrichosporon cavernicola]
MPRFPPPPERRVSEDGQFLPPERWERIEEGVYVAYLHLTHPRWHEENDVPGLYIDPPEGTRRLVLRLKWDPNYPRVRYADVVVGEVAMHADIVVVFEPVRVEPLGEPTSRDSEEGSGSWNRRRRSSSPTRPMKRPRHSSPNPTPTLHTRAPSTTEPDPDTYHDPLRGFGIFGNLCYALMNRVIEQGAAVCFVGVEACNRRELFFPPAQEDTAAAARTMLGIVLDSVLVLPEEFGWDCIHAWRSREMGEGWFDGLVATGMRRHFRFESAEAWRNEEGELRQLESGKIAWEEYEERMRDSAGVTERMVARFG